MRILVIGDAILDRYVYGSINRQSPEDNSIPIIDVEKEEYRLGGAMNVAANIRSISHPKYSEKGQAFNVNLSSVFSNFTGRLLYNKNIQCDDSCMIEENFAGNLEPSSAELIKTRIINKQTGKQIIRIDNRKRYSEANINLYKESFGFIDESYDAVVVSDYNKGLVNGFTLEKLENFTKPVFVDSKNSNLSFWRYVPNAIIKINEKEYGKASGGEYLERLIVTRGNKGCSLFNNSDLTNPNTIITHFNTNAIENPDVVGAGDVFLAGLVVSYMRHKDLHFAIEFANMCASISVKQQGTTEVRL